MCLMHLTLVEVASRHDDRDSQGYQGLHSIILFFCFVLFCFLKLTLIEVAGCHNNCDSQGYQGLHSIVHGTVWAVSSERQAGNCRQLEILS